MFPLYSLPLSSVTAAPASSEVSKVTNAKPLPGAALSMQYLLEVVERVMRKEKQRSRTVSELLLEQTLKKQQYRKRKRRQSGDGGEGDGEVETVTAEIPVDILRRISPLCEKMGLTIKCYVCYVITLMLCFIYFQRFSVKSWLGYLSGTRVLAA